MPLNTPVIFNEGSKQLANVQTLQIAQNVGSMIRTC